MTCGPATVATPHLILIIDDDQAIQELVALALGETYNVKRAATAGEGLAILRREPVAAVVLDHRLPDRTGLDLLTDIRSSWPRVPVVMITGYGSEWICASAFKLGILDYFQKPVNVFDLVHAVDRALSSAPEPDGGPVQAPAESARTLLPLAQRQIDTRVQKAIVFIQRRYWDRLSLTQVAREVAMSKSSLSHRFTEVVGVPFRTYLLTVRLDRAKHLLSTSRAPVTEVAQAIGFSDLPRFDKLFRRHTGVTPSAYRSRTRSRDMS